MMKKSISVFFPAYNEETNIERIVEATIPVLKELTDDYEIIIVDDASTDNTIDIAEEMAVRYSFVRVIHHETNKKLGGSLKTGFANAVKDIILYSDADLPFDVEELKRAVRVMEITGADIISAYRLNRVGEGIVRTIYSFSYNLIIKLLFGLNIKDVNFAFKLVNSKVFEKVTLKSKGSFIDAELLIRAQKHNFKIVQIGVDYFERIQGSSTLSSFRVIFSLIREMLALRKELI
ncbi:MAG: glycosyltransferase family 2 protein [bacterium]|nr:glycosyltransferase family 2 protein [bacterium]